MKKNIFKYLPYIFLLVFTITFFHNLFFPISIFTTPGDIAYFNYPLKNFLAESVKNHQLPFWTSLIGTGIPLLADSPIGALYLPNLILYYLLPTPIAFNLSYIFIFLTSSIGTYLLCRTYKLSKIASLYAALAFAFSGFFIARVIHVSFIQVASFLPFIFLLTEKYLTKNKPIYLLILSFLISQLIFAGYMQGLVYSIIASVLYLVLKLNLSKKRTVIILKVFALYLCFIFFGVITASAQVFPTLELLRVSSRSTGLSSQNLYANSGSPSILWLFIDPYKFGDISKGTFKSEEKIGFYWENVAYSGLLTPLLAFSAIFLVKKKRRLTLTFASIAFITLLLSLGKNSPFHIVYDIPPLNFFRIPARFLFITSFSISILAAFTLDKLSKNKLINIFVFLILLFLSLDIFINWYNFNPSTPYKDFIKKPETAILLNNTDLVNYRSSSLWPYTTSNNIIPTKTWKNNQDNFIFSFSRLAPDLNMLFSIPNVDYYTSLSTNRLNLFRSLYINSESQFSNNLKLNEKFLNSLKLQSAKYILTNHKTENASLEKIYENENHSNKIYIYEITTSYPRIRLVSNKHRVSSVSELSNVLGEEGFDFKNTAIVEDELPDLKHEFSNYMVTQINDTQNKLSFNIYSDGDGYLLISDSYYPGWQAKVNGNVTEIYPANANSRLINLPKGNSIVEVTYRPFWAYLGIFISVVCYLIIFIIFLVKFKPQKIKLGLRRAKLFGL